MTKFKQFERYKLRGGGTALVAAIEPEDGRLRTLIFDKDDTFIAFATRTPDGRADADFKSAFDIIPPEPEKHTGWVNVYRNDDGTLRAGGIHITRERAELNRVGDRVGCHNITIRAEFEDDD